MGKYNEECSLKDSIKAHLDGLMFAVKCRDKAQFDRCYNFIMDNIPALQVSERNKATALAEEGGQIGVSGGYDMRTLE